MGGLPRIIALLDADYSSRSHLDLTLCIKALTANRAHHPALLTQFVQAGGAAKVVRMVSGQDHELQVAGLQICRSLVDVKGPRKALVKEALLPPLLRCIRPAMAVEAVEPAAAALAVLVRHEPSCGRALSLIHISEPTRPY